MESLGQRCKIQIMRMTNFRGDMTDISAKKEALASSLVQKTCQPLGSTSLGQRCKMKPSRLNSCIMSSENG